MLDVPENLREFASLVKIIEHLRGPEGCPWDREQTHATLARFAIEEAHELAEAIEVGDTTHVRDELGDLLLQVVLHAEIARQEQRFDIHDVIEKINEKMVRRHPHVFGDARAENAEQVLQTWAQIKEQEKRAATSIQPQTQSGFDIPRNLPALLRAQKIGEKLRKLARDEESRKQVFENVRGDFTALQRTVDDANASHEQAADNLGDLLFSLVQLARHLNLDAEQLLRHANRRAEERFHAQQPRDSVQAVSTDIANRVQHGFVDSGGVKIHYAAVGTGPLVVLTHGIPGFWYDWRHLMLVLGRHYQVVAIDQRGFNLSDKPDGVENYTLSTLAGDIDAVVKHFGQKQAIIIGHDSGGWISWHYAMTHPDKIDRLVVLNLPHPRCIERELTCNPVQHKASDYARQYQQLPPGGRSLIHEGVTYELKPELYARAFKDEQEKYVEALGRTSMEAMINFYRANYPRPPYQEQDYPLVKCPVLMIHGLDDMWLMPETLNNTWHYVEKDLTLVTVPKAGHWVHLDAPDFVTKRIVSWLLQITTE